MSAILQQAATRAISEGWTVVSIDDTALVLTRKKPMSSVCMVLGVLGLLFAVVPGLLILIVGHLARGDEQIVYTLAEAEAYLAKQEEVSPSSWEPSS